jgi:hypothetical protein
MKTEDGPRKVDATELRRNRKMATILGTCSIIVLISLVYAFVQQIAAERNAERAFINEALAKESRQMADQNAEEARKQAAIAQELANKLEDCLHSKR